MVARYALFAVAIGFSFGALLRSVVVYGWFALGFMILLALILGVAAHFTKSAAYVLAAIALISVALGSIRAGTAEEELPPPFAPLLGTNVELTGVVTDDADIRETSQRVTLTAEREGYASRILAVLPLYPPVSYGETLSVEGVLRAPEPFAAEGGRVFRYDRYLAARDTYAVIERASFVSVAPPSEFARYTFGLLYEAKRAYLGGITRALPEPYAGLAAGITVGAKQGLGKELYDDFITSGLVHIVVLSGYNIMVVAIAVMFFFGRLPKRVGALAGAVSIALFVLAAGAGSASARAGLMAGLALFARASGRTYDALRGLAAAVLLMLLWNPQLLAYETGFQFSIAATIGIIVGTPLIAERIAFVKMKFFRELIATTAAAQIGVLPILLYQTGNLSPYALPANLLVLPVVPLAMLLCAISGFVGMLLPSVAPLVGAPAYAVLAYIVFIGESIATLPFADTVVPAFGIPVLVALYALLLALVMRARSRTAPLPSSS